MKRFLVLSAAISMAGFILTSLPGRASESQLSPERLDMLDQRGFFTPAFKAAVHDLVNTRQAVVDAKAAEKKLTQQLPDLKKEAADAQDKVAGLRQELAKYDHPDETDFVALQNLMKDPAAKPQDQLALAQAYVWAYATSPHQAEAQQNLQEVQKKMADQVQADKDAEAARVAARAKLIQRAQAHDLSLAEWRDFLRDMSQDDLLKYLGRPDSQNADYWVYSGDWTTDPDTQKKVGMQITFNGTRVTSVAELPRP